MHKLHTSYPQLIATSNDVVSLMYNTCCGQFAEWMMGINSCQLSTHVYYVSDPSWLAV